MESDVQGTCQHGDLRPGQGKVQSGRRPAATLRWTDCGVDSSAARSRLGPAHSQPLPEPYAITDTHSQPHANSDAITDTYSQPHAEPYAVADSYFQRHAEPYAVAGTNRQPRALAAADSQPLSAGDSDDFSISDSALPSHGAAGEGSFSIEPIKLPSPEAIFRYYFPRASISSYNGFPG